jgi:hypothetical protein
VIEFASGHLETAKKPLPRPERPERSERPARDPGYLPVFTQAPLLVGD